MFTEAETLYLSTYCENCCACLTAYLIYLCIDTHYEKVGRYNLEWADSYRSGVLKSYVLCVSAPLQVVFSDVMSSVCKIFSHK